MAQKFGKLGRLKIIHQFFKLKLCFVLHAFCRMKLHEEEWKELFAGCKKFKKNMTCF